MSLSNLPRSLSTDFLPNRHFQKRHQRQTCWQALWVIAFGFMLVSTNLEAEEKFNVDWSTLEESSMPQQSNPDSRISFVSKLSPGSIVAGPATEPPNPFPGSESSLYVTAQNPGDPWFRLLARPFVEETAAQGALEFDFRLVEGSLSFSLGSCDQPWIPEDFSTYAVTELKFAVSFTVDQEVQIRGRPYQTASIYALKSGENYRFMIKWNTSAPEGYTCFLNGEPLTPMSGSSAQSFSGTSSDSGINTFRITLGGSKDHLGSLFLGRISARAMPVDLFSPEGLIGK